MPMLAIHLRRSNGAAKDSVGRISDLQLGGNGRFRHVESPSIGTLYGRMTALGEDLQAVFLDD